MKEAFIDTSLQSLTLVIVKDGKVTYVTKESDKKKTAEEIIPEMKKGAEESGFAFSDFDDLFLTDGPGSYTGERIALTVGKVYAFLKKEVRIHLCSSLKVMSAVDPNELVLSLADARNEACFEGAYLNGKTVDEEKRAEKEEIASYLAGHKEAVIAVLPSFKETIEQRYPGRKVIAVNLQKALVKARPFFELNKDPYAMKARYLRGKEDESPAAQGK